MRFGYTAHAYQLTKATKRIVISSKSSETSITHLTALLPFKGTGKHTGSTKVKGQIREKKSCKGHRHYIGYGRNLGSRICTIAALRLCQFLTLAHPSQHSMSTKQQITAGDRGGWNVSAASFNDEIVVDLPTGIVYLIFFMVAMILCFFLCAEVIDGTQLLWSPYW